MKIFVTGATGFVGSHFVNLAIEEGHEVLALRRTKQSKPRVALNVEPEWLDKDMASVTSSDLEGCDAIVHLAAHSANVPYDTLEQCILQNVVAPIQLFREAIQKGIKRFIVAGTCFEYGKSGERYDYIPTDAPLEPTASYPASKAAASSAFYALAVEENLELLLLRIFQVYGEGELETRFWPTLRRKALAGEDMEMTEGKQIRDFVNVTDVASAFLNALSRTDLIPGKPLIENLGSGNPKSLAEFATEQWQIFSGKGKLITGAVPMRKEEVLRYVPKL